MAHSRTAIAGLVLSGLLGASLGVGGYTFVYAKGGSYLTNDPAACANCHIMSEQYAGWTKSSHHAVAVCNDCHTPVGFFAKYASKASNGFWHSFGFTTGRFPDPLRIKPHNRAITEGRCRGCHAGLVESIDHAGPAGEEFARERERVREQSGSPRSGDGATESDSLSSERRGEPISCLRCHSSVGHMR